MKIEKLLGLTALCLGALTLTSNSLAQTALDRSSWSLSSNTSQADLFSAIDGNASTRWSTNERQRDGQFFQVDLNSTTEISRIVLDTSGSPNDYPRDYEVSISTDGSNFTTIADGTPNSSITEINFSDINARFVRVDQNGSDNRFWWSIHEISIFGGAGNQPPPSGSENLALNGRASQSSVSFSGQPSRAIDGDTNGKYFRNNSVTHTNANQPNNAFWQVELEESSDIGQIVIWNRTDNCCEDRLSDFTVRVLNDDGETVYSQFFADHPEPNLTINLNVTGSTVRVELDGVLSLAEVQVFASPTDEPVATSNCSGDIQRCIDNRSSGSVVLEAKTYELRDTLILKSNVNLIGQGAGTVITWDDSIARTVNRPLIHSDDDDGGRLANVRLEDFKIRCTVDTTDTSDDSKRHHRGIFIEGDSGGFADTSSPSSVSDPSVLPHSNITFKRLEIYSCGSDGILVGGINGLYTEDLNLHNNGWNDDGDFWHNMYVAGANNVVMKQTSHASGRFESSPSGHGLRLSRVHDAYIENLRITENADHGLHMNLVSNLRGYNLDIFNNCRIPNGGCQESACYGGCTVDLTSDREE